AAAEPDIARRTAPADDTLAAACDGDLGTSRLAAAGQATPEARWGGRGRAAPGTFDLTPGLSHSIRHAGCAPPQAPRRGRGVISPAVQPCIHCWSTVTLPTTRDARASRRMGEADRCSTMSRSA